MYYKRYVADDVANSKDIGVADKMSKKNDNNGDDSIQIMMIAH